MTAEHVGISARGVRQSVLPSRWMVLLFTIAATALLLDMSTKVLAVNVLVPGQPVSLFGGSVTCVLTRNGGAALSVAAGYTAILTFIVTGVVGAIVLIGPRLTSPWQATGFGLLLGGASGNLVDRFFRDPGPLRGHVVDFLAVGWLPVFNVADIAVLGGAACLILLALFPSVGRSVRYGGHVGCDDREQI